MTTRPDEHFADRAPPAPRSQGRPAIAIVGVSALFPGSVDKTGFWRDILAGRDLLSDIPPSHWLIEDYYDPDPSVPDRTYAKRGAFVQDIAFDPLAFGIPPSTVPATDTSQLLALIVAQRVLEDACGGQFADMDKERVSVILGVTSAQELLGAMVSRLQHPIWRKTLREHGLPEDEVQAIAKAMASHYVDWQESSFPGLLGNVVAGRIANRLDLGGTNCVTDAACASSFSAVSMAVSELELGLSDMVITGGVDTMNDIFMFMCFSKTPALSATGDCRPFSDKADGTMLGEGLGMMALKRLDDAERDGDRIYAVIRGIGSSSDGRSKSVYAPRPEGQAKAIERTYQQAQYSPRTVELVEAHGTGTKAGDAAEFAGLQLAFGPASTDRQWCALGTVKSQIGHTKAAAGAAGLFKAVMAVHQGVLPATIKVDRPNPELNIDQSPFYLNTRSRPWVRSQEHPRRASVSSFGFGGSNFHVAVEAYNGPGKRAYRLPHHPTELVILSGDSAADTVAQGKAILASARQADLLAFLARASQTGYQPAHRYRLAIVAADIEALCAKITKAVATIEAQPERRFALPDGVYYGTGTSAPRIAFLFPGQGSQYLNMGAQLAMSEARALSVWDRSAEVTLDPAWSLHQVVFPRPGQADEQQLTQTQWAQPAIGVMSAALLAVVQAIGLLPTCVGGHSFGEVTALFAAGALSFEQFVQVARRRGALMADAARTPGAMIAVRAAVDALRPHLDAWNQHNQADPVVVANHNSPRQVVLSGSVPSIEAMAGTLEAARMQVQKLEVATAFHSHLVSPSAAPLAAFLDTVPVAKPQIPVYSNATAGTYPDAAAAIRRQLAEQLAQPVRFVDMIEAMVADQGIDVFVEVGPGSVLTGLTEQILAEHTRAGHHTGAQGRAVAMDHRSKHGVTALQQALGQLVAAGAPMQLEALWADLEPVDDPRQRPRDRMRIPINGANYGKPYPPADGVVPAPNRPRKRSQTPVEEAPAHAAAGSNGAGQHRGNGQTAAIMAADIHAPGLAQASSASSPAALSSLAAGGMADTRFPTVTPPEVPFIQAPKVPESPAPFSLLQTGHAMPTTPTNGSRAMPAISPSQTDIAPPNPNREMVVQRAPSGSHAPGSHAPGSHAWIAAFQEVQQATTDAHLAFQRSMAETHLAFLQTAETSMQQLATLLNGTPVATPATSPQYSLHHADAVPAEVPAKVLDEVPQRFMHQPPAVVPTASAQPAGHPRVGHEAPAATAPAACAPVAGLPMAPVEAPATPPSPGNGRSAAPVSMPPQTVSAQPVVAAAGSQTPDIDLQGALLAVVSEKTGYPVEMLNAGMALESDLGIDSIKRVEILSAMSERVPELPEVDAGAMAALNTLGEIVTYMQNVVPAAGAAPMQADNAAAAAQSAAPVSAQSGPGGPDLEGVLLAVVSEKTGYPADMLNAGMVLESDLGIDSIKRVEILSAMSERVPELPEVDAGAMAALNTLGEIVTYMQNVVPAAGAAPMQAGNAAAAAQSAAPVSAQSGPGGPDLEGVLLAVVSEKTGYPAEMLNAGMALESDLGIDSIKRVEILSAMSERVPNLPEVDAGAMAALNTLGEIVTYMQQVVPGTAPTAIADGVADGVASGDVPQQAANRAELGRYGLQYIARAPAGFAMPMLHTRGARVVVTEDGRGVSQALLAELQRLGSAPRVVDLRVEQVPEDTDVLILLDALGPVTSVDEAIAAQRRAFQAARAVARSVARGGALVTVQSPISQGEWGGWLAGLSGLVKTAAQEWPQASVKSLTIAWDIAQAPESAAAEIFRELSAGGPELEVVIGESGQRQVPISVREPVQATATLSEGAVVVASGGAKGVTAATLIPLAEQFKLRLALLGTTVLAPEPADLASYADEASLRRAVGEQARREGKPVAPAEVAKAVRHLLSCREIRATLAAIEKAGGQARYIAVDVTDSAAVQQALDDVRAQWGAIDIVIHGAGVIADKVIADKQDHQFDRVFNTKVRGLAALLAATRTDSLQALVMFSSIAGRCGNVGQSDYAMANEVLNKVAVYEARQRPGCVVRSLGWGPWAGGMVTSGLKAHFATQGIPLIALAEGAQMLSEELRTGVGSAEVVLGPRPRLGGLAGKAREVSIVVAVDRHSHPHLAGHVVAETPVLPVACVLEWFMRAVQAMYPDRSIASLDEFKVLSGVKLPHYADTGHLLQLRVDPDATDPDVVRLELRALDGHRHYSAVARLGAVAPPTAHPTPDALAERLTPCPDASIYGGALFHGEAFQVIESITAVGSEGLVGDIVGTLRKGWPGHWVSDPAANDGAFQLMVLWTEHVLGGWALPMAIGSFRLHAAPTEGPFVCVVQGEALGESRTRCNLFVRSRQGEVIAEFLGVEAVLRPGEQTRASKWPFGDSQRPQRHHGE